VLGARPARSGDLLAQRFPRAKNPHPRVAGGDPDRLGVILDRDLVDFNPPKGVGILGLQRIRELGDAGARDVRELLATIAGGLQLGGELVQAAVRDGLAALVIDHRIAQHPIEPPDDRVLDLVAPVEAADKSLLEDILGDGAVAHTTLDVPEKLSVVRHQLIDDLIIHDFVAPEGGPLFIPRNIL
jgi:hypothetical protein